MDVQRDGGSSSIFGTTASGRIGTAHGAQGSVPRTMDCSPLTQSEYSSPKQARLSTSIEVGCTGRRNDSVCCAWGWVWSKLRLSSTTGRIGRSSIDPIQCWPSRLPVRETRYVRRVSWVCWRTLATRVGAFANDARATQQRICEGQADARGEEARQRANEQTSRRVDEGVIEQGYRYYQQDPRRGKTDKPPAENELFRCRCSGADCLLGSGGLAPVDDSLNRSWIGGAEVMMVRWKKLCSGQSHDGEGVASEGHGADEGEGESEGEHRRARRNGATDGNGSSPSAFARLHPFHSGSPGVTEAAEARGRREDERMAE
jgi:hypothetical protein